MSDCCQHSQRNGDDNGQQNGQRRQQQRSGELGDKGLEYIPVGDITGSHIAGYHTAYPGQILCQEGFIQPQLCPFLINNLLCHSALVAIKFGYGITASHAHHGKGQEGNADQNGYQLQQALDNILQHNCMLISLPLQSGTSALRHC